MATKLSSEINETVISSHTTNLTLISDSLKHLLYLHLLRWLMAFALQPSI